MYTMKSYADPVIDTPQPMITVATTDATVTAGALAYLDADGEITAKATATDETQNALFGIFLEGAASGDDAHVLYRGDVVNVFGITPANRLKLSNVGVIVR